MKTVNEKGLNQIANILRERHVNGSEISLDQSCISAWAGEVETQLDMGNSPCFEIEHDYTVSGHTEEHELDDDCISDDEDNTLPDEHFLALID